jgi:hypothetical protein
MKNVRRRFCFAVEDGLAQRVVIPKSLERLTDGSECDSSSSDPAQPTAF